MKLEVAVNGIKEAEKFSAICQEYPYEMLMRSGDFCMDPKSMLGVLAIAGFLLSLMPTRLRAWRRQLGYLVLALGLSTSVVTPLKTLTGMHCPWSLSEFGGQEQFTPLLSERAPTANPGRCWPGGHASAGFSLLALFFVLRDRRPRAARIALVVALGLGSLFSLGRMLQGAHFLSHNLWTLLIDWVICVLTYRWLLYRAPVAQSAGNQVVWGETCR